MNSLIPEKRLDRNGRLVTKHVRSTPKQNTVARVPAPALPTAKKRTPAQTRPKPRTVAYSSPGTYDLCKSLAIDPQATDITIVASDTEFYSVLSVTSKANAFALLQAGIRSADEASNYLEDNGFGELIEDYSDLCEEALDRRIPPNKFIESSANLRGPESSAYYLDALEVYSSSIPKGTGSCSNLVITNRVYDGQLKLSDLKEVSYKKFNAFRDKDALVNALMQVGSGEANYTAAELSLLVDKHYSCFRDSLELANRYGAEITLKFDTPKPHYAEHLESIGTERERIISLLHYSDQVSKMEYENDVYRPDIPYELLEKCYNAGLSPLQVALDDYTEQQLDGLVGGITPGVSSGWL